jgi:cyanophycinase
MGRRESCRVLTCSVSQAGQDSGEHFVNEPSSLQLIIIGGAEDKRGRCDVLKTFVKRSGAQGARIAIMTVASEWPQEVGQEYVDILRALGAKEATAVRTSSREDADDPAALAAVAQASGILFTGGDQFRVTRFLKGTRMDKLLHERARAGVVIAGTSAGAAMMSSNMIISGPMPEIALKRGNVELGPGMEFLPGVIIDQHFEQRGRLRRLLWAVAQYPQEIGIGIDENTAFVVEGRQACVLGEGAVTVVDMGELTYTNLAYLEDFETLALHGVRIHILPAGYGFDLEERKPLSGRLLSQQLSQRG